MKRYFLSLIILAVHCMFCGVAMGQAYCSLRDPDREIRKLFPEVTRVESIVRVISDDVRSRVKDDLSPETLHEGELGQHTLYVVYKDEMPLGFVHVRSEASKWGLVEVAWGIDVDLRIVDFFFQRCRSRGKSRILSEEFKSQLRGLDVGEVTSLIKDDGSLDSDRVHVAEEDEQLAGAVVRCGMKTLLVTDLVWREDVERVRAQRKNALSALGKK